MLPNIDYLNKNSKLIVENLNQEEIDVYIFLTDEFQKGSILDNYVFQFTFRSFYRIDNAGLTSEFKAKYFENLEKYRKNKAIPIESIVRDLYDIPNRKGQKSLQFSFVTKLANTINSRFPIYDSKIAKVYNFREPYNYKTFDQRLNEYLGFYNLLSESYQAIIKEQLLKPVFKKFHSKFKSNSKMPDIKALDFIMWSAGKLLSKK
jgi:hypothetical protein